jgi:rubrerythrin
MAKTTDDLLKMFADAAESNIRYLAFGEAAERSGERGAAKLFRALARSKMFRALSHLRAAKAIDTTAENLRQAQEEETYDCKTAYPRMVQDAVAENAAEARVTFEYGMAIGPVILKWIGKAIADAAVSEDGSYYVCSVCGNVEFGTPPVKCPFCGADARDFVEVS